MRTFLYIVLLLLLTECMTTKRMAKKYPSDIITLGQGEESAVYLGINHVDILKIKGMEFYHLFVIILLNNPAELEPDFAHRASLFYDVNSRDFTDEEVVYYNKVNANRNTFWETTISASSECAYDTTAGKLGNLTKVPNFDRIDNHKSGKRVFVKKIATNDLETIKQILDYEKNYDNSLKYVLLPEASKKGYNSNSYFRGALEYSGLIDSLEVPSCFKSPGLSKGVKVMSNK
ncbi:MAG: hypothetical protein ACR2MT_18705 [Aurantibacter sp.]